MNRLNKYKNEMIALVTGKNGVRILVAVFVLILAALLFFSSEKSSGKIQQQNTGDETEAKLSAILSRIEGAGEVEVMVTYASSSEKVPAKNENSNKSISGQSSNENTTSSPVGGSSGALILKELAPTVQGVVVIAQGGDDFHVKTQLIRAVTTALDVPADRVDVFTMKQSKGEK